MKNFKINRLLTLTLSSFVLLMMSVLNAKAAVMYNTYGQYASNLGTNYGRATDGWTYPEHSRPRSPSYPWVGTTGGVLPFDLNSDDLPFAKECA